MGSYQFLDHSNQVSQCSSSPLSNTNKHGFSKSQMCLRKILHIIVSYPPISQKETSSSSNLQNQESELENKEIFGFDLNIDLHEEQPESLIVCSNDSVHEKNNLSDVEIDHSCLIQEIQETEKKYITNLEIQEIESTTNLEIQEIQETESNTNQEIQETGSNSNQEIQEMESNTNQDNQEIQEMESNTNQENQETGIKNIGIEKIQETDKEFTTNHENQELVNKNEENGNDEGVKTALAFEEKGNKNENECLGVPIEAAKKVEEESEAVKDNGEESSRVKRKRNQVLPSRYRDSVILQPLKRSQRLQKSAAKKEGELNNVKRRLKK